MTRTTPTDSDAAGPAGVIFVTRKFPPSVGGMQTLSAGVWRSLQAGTTGSTLIAHRGPNLALLWWFPMALARLVFRLARRRDGAVLAGDALTWALVEPVVRAFRVPAATMVMGLDMTYPGRLYGAFVRPALRRAPHVIAISEASAHKAREVGVDPDKVAVVRLGVAIPAATGRDEARLALLRRLELRGDARLVVTLGRLVRRKGVRWFVEKVLPGLTEDVHYVVAGDGPEGAAITEAAKALHVADRVHLLGQVDEEVREQVLAGADIFVQPNIPVPGDMEGFGLVTVEAALRGTPVVAADLEGIRDAVVDDVTGFLLPPADETAWIARLSALLADGEDLTSAGSRFQASAQDLYSESSMASAILAELGGLPERESTPRNPS